MIANLNFRHGRASFAPVLRASALRRATAFAFVASSSLLVGCGSDTYHNPDYGTPYDAAAFYDTGTGSSPGAYGEGGSGSTTTTTGPFDAGIHEAGPPQCADSLKRCAQLFTYPFNGETSVVLHGSYQAKSFDAATGDAMTKTAVACGDAGGTGCFEWQVTVEIVYDTSIQYDFQVNGSSTWVYDMSKPTISNGFGGFNNVLAPVMCANYTCTSPPVPPPGVFDWRDAVIYFTFIDRFKDGQPSNNCNVSGSSTTPYTSTNYLGGDWAGVTEEIDNNYFTTLGVNTLWITVPIKNADDVADPGVDIDNGNPVSDGHTYSGYHGYWPSDPTTVEPCFGSSQDLKDLVTHAHAKNIKVLFDYAMVHVHTESLIYQQHKNDNPAWFTPDCVCGANGCGNFDTSCWFTDYLAHYDYTNPATRTFSINAAISLIQTYGNDAFRLDAIKQVDPSWLDALRPAITSQILATESPMQRFYMVGETYDFQNRGLISELINSQTMLDGQFDFPLRVRLIESVLMRSTQNNLTPDDWQNYSRNAPPGMQGLAQFMDSNDTFYATDAVMSTFIGNHDLPRSIHYGEDTPFWSNSMDNGKENSWSGEPVTSTNSRAYERLANTFAVILTNKGAPLIYYGDEIGLPGAGDPDNRRMMQWSGLSTDQQGLHDRIAALTTIRAAHPAMRRGVRTTLFVDEDLWVYQLVSDFDNDTIYVAINRNDTDRTTTAISGSLTELLTNSSASGTLTIPARQTRVYISQ